MDHLASPVKADHTEGAGKEAQATARAFGRIEGDRSILSRDQSFGVAGRDTRGLLTVTAGEGHGETVLDQYHPHIRFEI